MALLMDKEVKPGREVPLTDAERAARVELAAATAFSITSAGPS
jgi:hypothetical protein